MTEKDFIAQVATACDMSQKDAKKVYTSIFGNLVEQVKAGDKVNIKGVGTFEMKDRAARAGRNPLTGEAIQIPASKAVKFTAAKAFKMALNEK